MTDPKYNNGIIVPDSAVPYTGPNLTFLSEEDQIKCDATIKDVIKKFDETVKILKDGNNLTELDKDALVFDPFTVTPTTLHQVEITAISLNKANIETLNERLNTLNIGDEIISITLPPCLKPVASPCEVDENKYKLIALLNIFATMLCDNETRISDLES